MRTLWDGLSLAVYAVGTAVFVAFALDDLPREGAVRVAFFLFFYLVLRVMLGRYLGIVRRVREDVEAYTGRPVESTGVLAILEEPDPPATKPEDEPPPPSAAPAPSPANPVIVEEGRRVVDFGSRRRPAIVRSGIPSAPMASTPRPANHAKDERRGIEPGTPPNGVSGHAPVGRAIVLRTLVVFALGLVMSSYAGFTAAMATSTIIAAAIALWTVIFPPRPWWARVADARQAGGPCGTGDGDG
jgi:hypothetical protein